MYSTFTHNKLTGITKKFKVKWTPCGCPVDLFTLDNCYPFVFIVQVILHKRFTPSSLFFTFDQWLEALVALVSRTLESILSATGFIP